MKKNCLFVVFFVILTIGIFGQNKNQKVSIFPVKNKTELPYIDSLASAVIDDVLFIMNQMEDYTVTDDSDTIIPSFSVKDLKKALKGKKYDFIIYGTLSGGSPLSLKIDVFDPKKKKVVSTQVGDIERMTEIFNVTDQLTLAILEDLTGEDITRGDIRFVNTGDPGMFQVTINNRKLDSGTEILPLIKGEYVVTVEAFNGKEKVTIFSEKVVVNEGEETRVEFVVPSMEPEVEETTVDQVRVGELFLVNKGAIDLYKVTLNDTLMNNSFSQTYLEEGEYEIGIEASEEKEGIKLYSGKVKICNGKRTFVEFTVPGEKTIIGGDAGSLRFVNIWNETYIPSIDGIDLAPGTRQYSLTPGIHKIEVFSRGGKGERISLYSKSVAVMKGMEKEIEFSLNPLSSSIAGGDGTGLLIFKNLKRGKSWVVYIDRKYLGHIDHYKLDAGIHVVEVYEYPPYHGYGAPLLYQNKIEIRSGDNFVIKFTGY